MVYFFGQNNMFKNKRERERERERELFLFSSEYFLYTVFKPIKCLLSLDVTKHNLLLYIACIRACARVRESVCVCTCL